MTYNAEKAWKNQGKRIVKLCRKHCHEGRELELLVNLYNYHTCNTLAELDAAQWHIPYHMDASADHVGAKCVGLLQALWKWPDGSMFSHLKLIFKNVNALKQAVARLQDSPRWCRGHEGLDHRWSPSWDTGREFCTKCGEPRKPEKVIKNAIELAVEAVAADWQVPVDLLTGNVDAPSSDFSSVLEEIKARQKLVIQPRRCGKTFSREEQWNRLRGYMSAFYGKHPIEVGLDLAAPGTKDETRLNVWPSHIPRMSMEETEAAIKELDGLAKVYDVPVPWPTARPQRITDEYSRGWNDCLAETTKIHQRTVADLDRERDNLKAIIDRLEDEKPRSNY